MFRARPKTEWWWGITQQDDPALWIKACKDAAHNVKVAQKRVDKAWKGFDMTDAQWMAYLQAERNLTDAKAALREIEAATHAAKWSR